MDVKIFAEDDFWKWGLTEMLFIILILSFISFKKSII